VVKTKFTTACSSYFLLEMQVWRPRGRASRGTCFYLSISKSGTI